LEVDLNRPPANVKAEQGQSVQELLGRDFQPSG